MIELLRLPEIPEGSPETQLAAIRTYLYRLAEQLQYILSTQQQERQLDRENMDALEGRLAVSPRLAQQTLALAGRQLREEYIRYQDFESDRQRQEALLWETRDHGNMVPAESPEEAAPAFRLEEKSGYQETEGTDIRFTALKEPGSCLKQVFAGRWQLE